MARYILIGVFLGAGILVGVLSYFGRERGSEHLDMVQERGQVRPARGLGVLDLLPHGQPRKWTGVLLDAGCPMRDAFSPDTPSIKQMPAAPAGEKQTGVAGQQAPQRHQTASRPPAAGSIEAQRADVMAQQVPDVVGRQMSMECAITGGTRGFALQLSGGKLKRLDEGGNTRALDAFQGTAQGQAVLSGQAPGAKPRAEVIGQEQGDRIRVERIRLL